MPSKKYMLSIVVATAWDIQLNRPDLVDNLIAFVLMGREDFSPPVRFNSKLSRAARQTLKEQFPWILEIPTWKIKKDFEGTIAPLVEEHGVFLEVTSKSAF